MFECEYCFKDFASSKSKKCHYRFCQEKRLHHIDDTPIGMRRCDLCCLVKDIGLFSILKIKRDGSPLIRNRCKDCISVLNKAWEDKHKDRISKCKKAFRANPHNRGHVIWCDTRRSDNSKGLENDLDIEFVDSVIENGCKYCGEKELLIGLDRIDNKLGHLKSNVNGCCIRCNFLRRDVPYDAWMAIVSGKSLTKIREENLFGSWTGRTRRTHLSIENELKLEEELRKENLRLVTKAFCDIPYIS